MDAKKGATLGRLRLFGSEVGILEHVHKAMGLVE